MDPQAAKWLLRGFAHGSVNFGAVLMFSMFTDVPLKDCLNLYWGLLVVIFSFIAALAKQVKAENPE